MTKKQKIINKKKKIIVIVAFMALLLIISAITTVIVLNNDGTIKLGSSKSDVLYYNEEKAEEENKVLVVNIKDKNETNKADEQDEKDSEKQEENVPEENTNQKVNTNNESNTDIKNSNTTKKVSDMLYYIKVNYKANVVTVYKKDDSGNYTKAVKAMVCSCGDATPTSGVYSISDKYTWRLLQGNVYGQYACRITGHILFHSVPYTQKDKSSLEWREYDKLGTSASLGCIRLTVKDAKWIYDNCASGTQVEFYGDTNPGPLGQPTAQKISDDTEVRGWDPTDPDKANPWTAYLKKKEEAEKAAEEAKKAEEKKTQEASTKPVEDKTNTTNKTQETTTTPVENKNKETNKTSDNNTSNMNNTTTNKNTSTDVNSKNTNAIKISI